MNEDDEEPPGSPQDDDRVSHSYNLRGRGNINYKPMHRYGEAQLMQIKKDWTSKKVINDVNNNKKKGINIKSNDLFRRTVGSLFTQLSKVDKHAQVSVNEGIQKHGDKAVATVLAEFSQQNDNAVGPVVIPQLIK